MDRLDVGRPGFRAVRVRVSARDIENGRPGSCFSCPLARAINRHLKPGIVSGVARGKVYLHKDPPTVGGFGAEVWLPMRAERFRNQFDAGGDLGEPKPFAFWFPLPVAALKRPGVSR